MNDPGEALVGTLKDLVRESGRDASKALAYCEARLEAAGYEATTRVEPDAAVFQKPAVTRPLVLSGHVDVVPAGDGWDTPPFDPVVRDGRVIGRGVSDMLGAVAAFLVLADARPDLPLACAFTTDEETGMRGAEALVAADAFPEAAGVVVGEPTDFRVGVAEKGVLWVRLKAQGRSAHGSMPEKGENAVVKLLDAWSRVAAVPLGDAHPRLGHATRNLARINGGTAVNVVPDAAEAEVDFRLLPGTDPEGLLATLRDAAAPDADVDVIVNHPPFAADPDGVLAPAAVDAVRAARGDVEAVGLPYGTEACKYAQLMDAVVLGPGSTREMHTRGESIAVADLVDGYRAYERLAENVARGR